MYLFAYSKYLVPPPLAVAISLSAEIQLKKGFLPFSINSLFASDPKPVPWPILAAPPDDLI